VSHQFKGNGYAMPLNYLRYRTMVEYLIVNKGMTYSEIVETDMSESDLWDKILYVEQGSEGNT